MHSFVVSRLEFLFVLASKLPIAQCGSCPSLPVSAGPCLLNVLEWCWLWGCGCWRSWWWLGVRCCSFIGLVFLVPCQGLLRTSARWWSEPSLDHQVTCVTSGSLAAMAFRFVSCWFGRFVLLGGMCRPGCLVLWEGAGGCRAQKFGCMASCVCFCIIIIMELIDLV